MAFSFNPSQATALLNILTLSDEATAIYSGNNITIEYANDAMLAFWGKDNSIIGKELEVGVPELVGQPFKAMLQQVLKTGKSDIGTIAAETLINDVLETRYYAYKYIHIAHYISHEIYKNK